MTGSKEKRPEIVPCTVEHSLPDGSLVLLDAVETITPASSLLEMGGVKTLVDCGAPKEWTRWQLPEKAKQAEALLITHAHHDHIGGLSHLLATDFNGPIFATSATFEILQGTMKDSMRLNRKTDQELWDFEVKLRKLQRPVKFNETFKPIEGKDLQVTFYETGHLPGAASIELISEKSRVILSGDLGRPNSPLFNRYNTNWNSDRPVDLVLMECTHGDGDHPEQPADTEERLAELLKKTVEEGGHTFVPSFAIGRTQNFLYLLNKIVTEEKLKAIPVILDTPLGLKQHDDHTPLKRLYEKESITKMSRGEEPIDFDALFGLHLRKKSQEFSNITMPMLFIAGSPMYAGAQMDSLLKMLLPKPETTVIFPGEQGKGSPARVIQDAGKNKKPGESELIDLDGDLVTLRANVYTIPGIYGHPDRKELADWLKAIPNVKKVALHHAGAKAQAAFAEWYSGN